MNRLQNMNGQDWIETTSLIHSYKLQSWQPIKYSLEKLSLCNLIGAVSNLLP